MKITISGKSGSGKSTIAKKLAKKLNFEYISMGKIYRDYAEKNNLELIKVNEMAGKDKAFDKKIDDYQKTLNKKDNFILDSRLGNYFIKNNFSLFIDVDDLIRAKRVYDDKRKNESYNSIEEVKKELIRRDKLDNERFNRLYNYEFLKKTNYDLIIDSSDKTVNRIVNKIINKLT